jgi:AraC-like DNA-binding protein
MTEVIAAGRVRNGRLRLEYGRDSIDTSTPYLRPAGSSVAHMEDVVVELIELDPTAFSVAAGLRLEGSGRVLRRPTPTAAGPSSSDRVATWYDISDYVTAAAFDATVFHVPLIRSSLFGLITAGMLATFPLSVEVGSPGATGAQPAAIRRALTYIDDHLLEPIDVVTIAEAARLSPRGLQAAFQRHLGITPMQHVRARRLAAAHEELARTDGSSGVTVAMIARRWGFPHLTRFAQRHRAAYGENPSQTLQR